MTTLSYLHEPGVLWNLKCRYSFDDIYTWVQREPASSLS